MVTEFYDEIVFYDPTESNLKRLKGGGAAMGRSIYAEHCAALSRRCSWPCCAHLRSVIDFNEEAELKKIKSAHKKVKNDIAQLKEQYDALSASVPT